MILNATPSSGYAQTVAISWNQRLAIAPAVELGKAKPNSLCASDSIRSPQAGLFVCLKSLP
jgi:hypothetical protein